jgi:CheY-like chemotaxis protein
LGNALDTLIAGMRLATSDAPINVKVNLAGREAVMVVRTTGEMPDDATVDVVRRLSREASGDLDSRPDGFRLVFPVSRPRLRRVGVNRRILLVDDTKVTQRLASMMLADAGLEIDLAGDGIEAIERLREKEYGAVLMDIRMPRLDGLSATRQIRSGEAGAEKVDVPIIAMTAEAAPGAAEIGLLTGFDAYLTKPFNKDALLALVGRYLPDS